MKNKFAAVLTICVLLLNNSIYADSIEPVEIAEPTTLEANAEQNTPGGSEAGKADEDAGLPEEENKTDESTVLPNEEDKIDETNQNITPISNTYENNLSEEYVFKVEFPTRMIFTLDPFGKAGKETIYSEKYEIKNYSDKDVIVFIEEVYLETEDTMGFVIHNAPFEATYETDINNIYTALKFESGELVTFTEEKKGEQADIYTATASDGTTGNNAKTAIKLGAASYSSDGDFVALNEDSVISFEYTGIIELNAGELKGNDVIARINCRYYLDEKYEEPAQLPVLPLELEEKEIDNEQADIQTPEEVINEKENNEHDMNIDETENGVDGDKAYNENEEDSGVSETNTISTEESQNSDATNPGEALDSHGPNESKNEASGNESVQNSHSGTETSSESTVAADE